MKTVYEEWKCGDIIWQRRMPGGECLIVEVWEDRGAYTQKPGECIWADADFPVLSVLHPTEGLITDPSYYYVTLDEMESHHTNLSKELEDWKQDSE